MKKYIDEFCKLPADKMAQKMEDMTFLYNETKVPKKHYKDLLQKEIIELLATEDTMQLVLLNAVLNQLQSLKKESPKLFLKALICMDFNLKVDTLSLESVQILEQVVAHNEKRKTLLDEEIIQSFKNLQKGESIWD
jgi:hypothetical protein